MRLVIVRHAEAAAGHPDELRPLTADGRAQARRLGADLREAGLAPAAVVCILLGEPVVDDRLAPGATPDAVRAVAVEHGDGGAVVLVGHQPDCGRAAAELGGGVEPAFPPCGHHTVEL
jgi:phosphohistidine phosphatase